MADPEDDSRISTFDGPTRTLGMAPNEPADVEAAAHAELLQSIVEAQKARYYVEGVLAAGGMGRIDKVIDRTLNRRVVRKCIHDELAKNPKQARMFVREARVTGTLQHPCIVPVHDLGVDEKGHLYYTMERVSGRTLGDWLVALPPGALDRTTLFDLLDVVVRVCDALGFAHRLGVLHCDVKPANVMVGEFGQVHLMDWGIARLLREEQARPPGASSLVVGSPTYMAPEQARGEPLDPRADVFTVGGLIYQIITRRAPFQGPTLAQTLTNATQCKFMHPDQVTQSHGVPSALVRIILKAMAAKPEDRYENVGELRDALVRFMRGVDVFPRLSFNSGDVIVREGEEGHQAFVVESGRCEVARMIDGVEEVIRVMRAGEVFGEMAILSPGARTATVRALEPTTLVEITADALEGELDSMKPWMGALVRTLAERFRDRDSAMAHHHV